MWTIQLQNHDSSHSRSITSGEAKRMEAKGEIRRVTPRQSPVVRFRVIEVAIASNSKTSLPTITIADMRKVAGEQRLEKGREEQDIERLIGFGLVPENIAILQHGYL